MSVSVAAAPASPTTVSVTDSSSVDPAVKAGPSAGAVVVLDPPQLPPRWMDFIVAERYLNGGSRTYSAIASYSELQKKYQPQSELTSFGVPSVTMPKKALNIHLAHPNLELLAHFVQGTTARFLVHPQFYKNQAIPYMDAICQFPQEDSVEVMPTASSRTALVISDKLPPHCVKLHCPVQVSRFNRKLDGRDIDKSIATSREFDRAIKEEAFPKCFGFLPESIGVSIGDGPHAWGYLVREMEAHPIADGPRRLLPFFSLYSSDLRKAPDDDSQKPLLVDLIDKSGLDPTEFVLEKLMFPIVESWCFLARDLGILAQAHGQNLMLETDDKGMPTRVVFRDLSTYMDRARRAERGLSNEDFPAKKDSELFAHEERNGYYSLTYDSFVGHHLFEYLAKAAEKHYGIEPDMLKAACREKFKQCFPEAERVFPRTVQYYSKECVDGFRQDLTDTGELPEWRPVYEAPSPVIESPTDSPQTSTSSLSLSPSANSSDDDDLINPVADT